MSSRTTITKHILAALLRRERITQVDAFERFGTTRLASIIHNLRKAGYDIKTATTQAANGSRFAVYYLDPAPSAA
ncbi:hypothetical protein KBY27_22715 [Ruegeria pomeroyi]|uniref:Winged helix-turn-helix domain-containing protein n=1 Tax=Ruegeria pomeroyi TaxID=89184 RepID=A0A9Q3ZRJ8_9RHOB|nr:hypothetical protein [Ruegeria pomeroyi]